MANVLNFLITYWQHILIGLLFIAGIVIFVINQRKNIIEWLVYVVTEAEKNFGSKMGKIKLRQVYDWFIATFPIISKIVPFKAFSSLVDIALKEMKYLLDTNENIAKYVDGEAE